MDFIQNMNSNLELVKDKIDGKVEQMNDMVDMSIKNKERYKMTVSNLDLKL